MAVDRQIDLIIGSHRATCLFYCLQSLFERFHTVVQPEPRNTVLLREQLTIDIRQAAAADGHIAVRGVCARAGFAVA